MRTLIAFCCVLMLGLTLTPDIAEAKRFGGGGSFGKMFSTPKKVSPTRQTAPAAAPASTTSKTAAGQRRPGIGGLMGGLLAGGLLGAMFMGGAFEGIQMMDILIIAVIGFILFKLFAGAKTQRRSPQYAGHPEPESVAARTSVEPLTSAGSWGQSAQIVDLDLPAWFDKAAFLEGSSNHFSQLQQAWNQNDLPEIKSYCSEELFDALVLERGKLNDSELDNDLVSVVPELVGFAEAEGQAQVSILFNGWMREGAEAETTEFSEIWHLTRDLSAESADWFIVGIEQVG
ncbi:MAG: Tim44-like domain-containing protein [Motiliproteus sp.]